MAHLTYQRTVVGYHGCDAAVADGVLAGTAELNLSRNTYDWLGEGVYFWEHGPQRAYEWAVEQARLGATKVRRPALVAARINLGVCCKQAALETSQLFTWRPITRCGCALHRLQSFGQLQQGRGFH
jgi:hypothetical protein